MFVFMLPSSKQYHVISGSADSSGFHILHFKDKLTLNDIMRYSISDDDRQRIDFAFNSNSVCGSINLHRCYGHFCIIYSLI